MSPKLLGNEVCFFADISTTTTKLAAAIAKDKRSVNPPNRALNSNTCATKFSNPEFNGATKNSNSDNVHNIISKPPNSSTNKPINHENFNNSTKNDIISQ